MQTYNVINNELTGAELPGKIYENLQSLKSEFSGTSFPTENLVAGMTCFRTDQNKIYKLLSDLATWRLVSDLNVEGGVAIATQAEAEEGSNNTKVMTPLRVKNAIDKQRPIKTFTSLSQIGLDKNASIEDICNALPSNSMLIVDIIRSEYPNILTPGLDGLVKITKKNNSRCALEYCVPESGTYTKYEGGFASWANPKFYGWVQVNMMPIATQSQAEAGANNTTVMTPLRTAQEIEAKAFTKDDVVPIANGGTGAATVANARKNLGLSTAVTGASISGKVITLTFANGTTKTLTTQDTDTNNISGATLEQNGFLKLSNKLTIQWGYVKNTQNRATITFKTAFSTLFTVVSGPGKIGDTDTGGFDNSCAVCGWTTTNFTVSKATQDDVFYVAFGLTS